MSIEQNWKELDSRQDEDLSSLLQPGLVEKLQSSNPLLAIKKRLVGNMVFSGLISAGYVLVLIRFHQWPVLVCIGAIFLFTLWTGVTAYFQYKSIHPFMNGRPLLAEMEKHYAGIRSWMRGQVRVAAFVYPVAAAGGFMVGGMIGSGKGLEQFMTRPKMIVALLLITAVLAPTGLFLARWLHKKSFGKHLATLKKNIDELKANS
ncbi:MAG: hypothetical protein INR73_09790 [Williamsia sp.]|nr:hypothetical protein [Williamsia sp.]